MAAVSVLIIGGLLIYIAATGRAEAVWLALTEKKKTK